MACFESHVFSRPSLCGVRGICQAPSLGQMGNAPLHGQFETPHICPFWMLIKKAFVTVVCPRHSALVPLHGMRSILAEVAQFFSVRWSPMIVKYTEQRATPTHLEYSRPPWTDHSDECLLFPLSEWEKNGTLETGLPKGVRFRG